MTAFKYACRIGNIGVVKLLLNHSGNNIDLNARAKDGMIAF